jgi:hypothetical protein
MAFFIGGNDFDESLLKYKSGPRIHYFADNGELRRIDYEMSTTKKILRESAFLRYLILNLEPTRRLEAMRKSARWSDHSKVEQRTRDSKRAVDYFLDQLPSKSGLDSGSIAFVLDAVRPEIYSPQALQADGLFHSRMRQYFSEQAKARGYQVLDMQPVFIAKHALDGSRFEAAPTDGHWNALANRLVAEQIEKSAVFARVFPKRSIPARQDSAYLSR